MWSCGLVGNHDISMFPNLGGGFDVSNNPLLKKIIHTASTQVFYSYNVENNGLVGNHDMSMLTNLGGVFAATNNPSLTAITHTYSNQIFNVYTAILCGLKGNHDMSMFPNLGGSFTLRNNTNLTGITHTASTQVFHNYDVQSCNLTGTHDISMLTNWVNGHISLMNNINLTNVIFPLVTGGSFKNSGNILSFGNTSISLYACNLGYINFLPLSAATMNVNSTYGAGINMINNNLTPTEINHILTDFNTISTLNPTGWSGVTLSILLANSSPDTTSGGYNGIAAINSLTGSPKNWIIT